MKNKIWILLVILLIIILIFTLWIAKINNESNSLSTLGIKQKNKIEEKIDQPIFNKEIIEQGAPEGIEEENGFLAI